MSRRKSVVVLLGLVTAWVLAAGAAQIAAEGKRFIKGGKGRIDFPPDFFQPPVQPAPSTVVMDEDELFAVAGLSKEGPGLVTFFRARARTEAEPGRLEELLRRFAGASEADRIQAAADLVAAGPLAIAGLRRISNDLGSEAVRELAKRCLACVEGPQGIQLTVAAARHLAKQKPAGAAEALLGYLPFAENEEVSQEVGAALKAVAVVDGSADQVLVKALSDPLPLRRAAAAAALSQNSQEHPAVEKLLQDSNPEVRMTAAMSLAKAYNGAAVTVLIDLVSVLPANKRSQVEEVLSDLAGEWAPTGGPSGEDDISRKIRRDCWAAWWSNTDGPALTALLKKHTLTPEETDQANDAIRRLNDKTYQVREKSVAELIGHGRRILPMLREVIKDPNSSLESLRRAQRCIDRIEQEPARRLPSATIRILAARNPAGAAETLLAYTPFAEEEYVESVRSALAAVAMRDRKPEPAMMKALENKNAVIRAAAAEALAQGGGPDGRAAVQKLLADENLNVRLRAALGLAPRDEKAVPVLIDLIAASRDPDAALVHDFLAPLAGENAPQGPEDNAESRKKCSAAWKDWWKENGSKTDLNKLVRSESNQSWLGYTVIAEHNTGTILELGRDRKVRWSFGGTRNPTDAWVLPNNRVVVAEYGGNLVSCRDLKGAVIWQKQMNCNPHNIQVLPNGNVFIAGNIQLAEVDRNGKDVPMQFKDFQNIANQVGQFSGAYKTRKGEYIVQGQNGNCMRLDASGKQLKVFNTGMGNAWLDVTPAGKIIMATNSSNMFREYDMEGKQLVELNHNNISMVTGLPNGNFLVACHGSGQVVEMDRKGKVLWEHRMQGPFRARGR